MSHQDVGDGPPTRISTTTVLHIRPTASSSCLQVPMKQLNRSENAGMARAFGCETTPDAVRRARAEPASVGARRDADVFPSQPTRRLTVSRFVLCFDSDSDRSAPLIRLGFDSASRARKPSRRFSSVVSASTASPPLRGVNHITLYEIGVTPVAEDGVPAGEPNRPSRVYRRIRESKTRSASPTPNRRTHRCCPRR